MRWPKNWSFSFSIIPSKEHPGLISFRMDWLDACSKPKRQLCIFLMVKWPDKDPLCTRPGKGGSETTAKSDESRFLS